MIRSRALSALLSLLCWATLSGQVRAQAGQATLVVVGEDGTSKTLAMSDLAALPQMEIIVQERDSTKIVFRGPTIRALMTLVGAPTGHALRGPSMLLAILADAADGYRAAFMLAELDEQFGARLAIVALSQDGHALSARDGPLRIVVAGEPHHARWMRQLTRLRLVRVGG